MDDRTPTITQAMIDAYDEYTHLTLDRRGFMRRLTALAGLATAAAAIAPLMAASSARAAIVAPDDPRLAGVWATYPGASGEMKAYVARPADATDALPCVLVIHENRGLNAHIQDVARRLALEGFLVVAPDFLSPAGGTPPDAAAAFDTELWWLGPDGPVSMGVIPKRGESGAAIPTQIATLDGKQLAVSLEPRGGSPSGSPTGPVIAVGEVVRAI